MATMRSRMARLKRRPPTSADFWVQALKAVVVESVNHSADVRLIDLTNQRDLIDRCVHHRRHQNLCALAECLAARFSKVRQELHLTLFQRANEQRRSSHASSTSMALIFTDPKTSFRSIFELMFDLVEIAGDARSER